MFLDKVDLFLCIRSILIERYDYRLTEILKVPDMSVKICKSSLHAFCIRFLNVLKWCATMHLESVESCNENCEVWFETALAAFDIEKFLSTEISSESRLCNYIFTKGHSSLGCYNRVAAMCNVSEWTSVDECRSTFCCLDQIWLESSLEKDKDGTSDSKVLDHEWLVVKCVTEKNIVNTSSHICQVCRKTENCHKFRSWGNIESRFCSKSICTWSKSCHNISE